MNNNKALREIYDNLNNGYCYFEHIDASDKIRFPYDNEVLYIDYFHQDTIHWQNFGSSANKNTLKDLKFIIAEIFETNPISFLTKYHLKKIWF